MSVDPTPAQADLLRRALDALRQTRGRLEAYERGEREPIAVVGVGCRLPGGADDPEAFWTLLDEGRDAVSEVPLSRWDSATRYGADAGAVSTIYARHAGLLTDIDGFDAAFFGISPREVLSLDPQQRLVLETAWAALEDAGLPASGLRGSSTGVFVGATARDYAARLQDRQDELPIDAYYVSGNSLNFIAGRLAYTLGLRGPALCVDTACSSALTALHLAVRSLRQGECSLALAGGVNLVLVPEVAEASCRSHLLAADGRCKTFDAAADGIVRGEGAGMLALMRHSDAEAQGLPILALIRGTAINQDGASSGLMTPNLDAQVAVVRAALADAGVAPSDIDYVEAHGTGTALGDPIELRALAAVFADAGCGAPVRVGSVKTNIGHLESAAGIAGVIKVVLALRHERLPRHLHFETPTPHVDWSALPLRVVAAAEEWARGPRARRAGVSAFGGSGSNAHVIVEEAPAPGARVEAIAAPHLLILSARSSDALEMLRGQWVARVGGCGDAEELAALCAKASAGRAHFEHRLAAVADDGATLAEALRSAAPALAPPRPPDVAFLFTGQGAQYAGMGRELYDGEPAFREAVEALADAFRENVGVAVQDALWGRESTRLHETWLTQPALFVVQHALAALWRHWGIVPDRVAGHSVGEIAAACVAGALTPENGLVLAAARGRLMADRCEAGAMSAVDADGATVQAHLGGDADVTVAACNAPDQSVLAGRPEAMARAARRLEAAGLRVRPLAVSHAFHSPLMEPMLEPFAERCAASAWRPAALPLISSLTGEYVDASFATPEHWVRHARQAVQFARVLDVLRRSEARVLVEIGPGRTLIGLARRNGLEQEGVASMLPDGERRQMMRALGQLYCAGAQPDWGKVRPRHRSYVAAPGYTFERRPCLVEGRDAIRARKIGAQLREWSLSLAWEPAETVEGVDGATLLFAGGDATSAGLASVLSARGPVVQIARPEVPTWENQSLPDPPPACAVYAWSLDVAEGDPVVAAERELVAFAQALAWWQKAAPGRPFRVCVDGSKSAGSAFAALALRGAVLSLALEASGPAVGVAEIDGAEGAADLAPALRASARSIGQEPWLRKRGGRLEVPRIVRAPSPERPPSVEASEGLTVISGGAGALGLALAEQRAETPKARLLLVSRRAEGALPRESRARLERLRARGATIEVAAVDVADAAALAEALASARTRLGPIRRVIHAAGELSAGSLSALASAPDVKQALHAKVRGAWNLHVATADDPVHDFVLVSSASAVWGGPGFASYAAANACLEALAERRRAEERPALCVLLGPLDGSAMARGGAGDALAAAGMRRLPLASVAALLDRLASEPVAPRIFAAADWPRFVEALATRSRARWFEPLARTVAPDRPAPASSAPRATSSGIARPVRIDRLCVEIAAAVEQVLRVAPGHEQPLHALGIDSILALEIRDRVSRQIGHPLPAALTFERPTVRAVAEYVDELLHGRVDLPAPVPSPAPTAQPIAIVGLACRFPGGAQDAASYWRNLVNGVDGIVDRPVARFEVDAYLDASGGDPRRAYVMAAGLLDEVECFDAAFFGIGPREARLMDPQQRLALETAWHALEDAGIDPGTWRGSRTGVFLGVADAEYLTLLRETADLDDDLAYLGTGSKLNVIPGRISYVLGLQGPSLAVDTACSSSAVAIHLAAQSLARGECDAALAGGVNVILDPRGFAPPCRAKMLAPDGRCKSFDASADGYVRSEGVGIVVLKRLADAQRDGDRIIAVVRGSAVNQDGRSSSLTAPNPAAQRQVIETALAAAGLTADAVDYVEAHGTGTALGDPIELKVIAETYGAGRAATAPLWIGAVKSQIGHTEAAAGVAGIIKLALALEQGELPPNLHFQRLNPEVGAGAASLRVVDRRQAWPQRGAARVGAVSAFGFSGTNAHLVLSTPPARAAAEIAAAPVLCVSAATSEALPELRTRWASRLSTASTHEVAALCGTSQSGRWSGPRRVAVLAHDGAAAVKGLSGDARSGDGGVFEGDGLVRPAFRVGAPLSPGEAATLERVFPLRLHALDPVLDAALAETRRGPEVARLRLEMAVVEWLCDLQALPAHIAAEADGLAVAAWAAGALDPGTAVAAWAARRGLAPAPARWTVHEAKRSCLGPDGTDIAALITEPVFWTRWTARQSPVDAVSAAPGTAGLDTAAVARALATMPAGATTDAVGRALAWSQGVDVVWPAAGPGLRVDAPLYPFARTRHWPHAETPLARLGGAGRRAADYVLGERVRLPRSREVRFRRRFAPQSPAYVDHHRLLGTVVVPAASHLSMMLSAWRALGRAFPCAVEDLRLLSPLVLHDAGARDVELILRPEAGDAFAVELVSGDAANADDVDGWVTHAECVIRPLERSAPEAPVRLDDIADWRATVSGEEFYGHFWQHGYTLGPSFRWLGEGWVKDGATLRRLRLPALPDALDSFELYPGLIDTCFSVLSSGQLDWVTREDEAHIFIPVSVERLEFYRRSRPGAALFAHARARDEVVAAGERRREDIVLLEESGSTVARIVGFETRRAQREALRLGFHDPHRDWLYEETWSATPASAVASERRRAALVVDAGTGLAADWAADLRANGCVVATAAVGADRDDYAGLVDRAAELGSAERLDIWMLAPLAMETAKAVSAEADQAATRAGVDAVFHLWRALVARLGSVGARLFVVTRGACATALGDAPPQVGGAAAWGFVRGLSAEHEEAVFRLIDLDPFGDAAADLHALRTESTAGDAERQVVWRGGQRRAARLQRYRQQTVHAPLRHRADRRCVVSGGFGGIGRRLVARLLESDAGCVQVLTRRIPDGDAWEELSALAQRRGVELEAVVTALTEPELVERLAAHPLPIGTVFHAAGIAEDALVLEADPAQPARVYAGKWFGAQRLAALVRRVSCERVVFFSSLAGALPGPGQAAYAAANRALDAIAAQLRSEGTAAVSIGFGPWAEAGMAARRGRAYTDRLNAMGITPLAPDQAFHLIDQLAQEPTAAVLAAPIQWSRFLAARPECARSSFVGAFRDADAPEPTEAAVDALGERVRSAAREQREDLLVDELRPLLARVLGLPDPRVIGRGQRLFDLGVDSLAAMELRDILQRRLGLRLRATVLFDYPTLAELAGFLVEAVSGPAPTREPSPAAEEERRVDVEALSDADAEARLLAELQR